ncbi:MAG: hypothetical protein K6F83_08685 [Clostridiales bacterium]|nr:hypothetical protein [Clostridiales bacterium]
MSNYPTDPKYKPLTAWQYFWLQILFAIPVVGFVFLIVFSISPANINRRSFARSYFCVYIVAIVLILILVFTGLFGVAMDYISN